MAKILGLSSEDVVRLDALVLSLPGLYDSSEAIVARRNQMALETAPKA